jgi:Ser-tRNA(Ala) deacylase AlaX
MEQAMNDRPTTRWTQKFFNEFPWVSSIDAVVVESRPEGLRLDRTIAYAESGGQEGDCGVITAASGDSVPFSDTQRGPGRLLFLPGFSGVHVEVPIYHTIPANSTSLFHVGDTIRIAIDTQRRARLTLSHSASHLLYLGVKLVRPDAIDNVIGCHIKEDQARFDFSVTERFTADEIVAIQQSANQWVSRSLAIFIDRHVQEPEALYWRCDGYVIPCGGTHLADTGPVGPISVQRKNIGKGKERLICTFPDARPPYDAFTS